MSDKAAILANFADWRPVKTRNVLQLIFEVPLERQTEVLTHLGPPLPAKEIPCGIALVQKPLGDATPKASGEKKVTTDASTRKDGDDPSRREGLSGTAATSVTKPKQRWKDMRPSARAALLTKDPEFWGYVQQFVTPHPSAEEVDETFANEWLKNKLGIQTKAMLDKDAVSLRWFETMEDQFFTYRNARQMGAA